MHQIKGEQTAVYFKKFFGETAGILWKYPEWKGDPVPDEPIDPGGRGIWDSEKWSWVPKIPAAREKQSETGDPITLYGIQSEQAAREDPKRPDRKSPVWSQKCIEKGENGEGLLEYAKNPGNHLESEKSPGFLGYNKRRCRSII